MITLLLRLLRLLPFLCGGPRQLALENLALRHQLAVYKRTVTRPKLRPSDRLFRVWLARVWAGWRQPLVIVTPATVLRWQRRRFREYWTALSRRPNRGRPPVNARSRPWLHAWPPPIRSGAPRESMGSSSSSGSTWPSAVSRLLPRLGPRPGDQSSERAEMRPT
jgi:hypothetical protein